MCVQCVLLPLVRGPAAAGGVPGGRAGGRGRGEGRSRGGGASARRGGMRRGASAGRPQPPRLHRREGLRQALGHYQPRLPCCPRALVTIRLLGEYYSKRLSKTLSGERAGGWLMDVLLFIHAEDLRPAVDGDR